MSMKIVYLSRSRFPSTAANSVHVMKMCEAFASIGHAAILLGHFQNNKNFDVYTFYGVRRTFRIENVPSLDGSATDFLYIIRSILKAKAIKPDLAYGRSLEACLGVAMLGIPTVYEMHAPPRGVVKKILLKTLLNLPSLRRVVTISEGLANYLKKEFVKTDRLPLEIVVAHDGADPQCFHPSVPQDFEELALRFKNTFKSCRDKLQVGYIGSLYPGKGMEVISELVHLCPWAVFHIVGGNVQEISLWKNRCSRNGELPPNIFFHGFIPHALVGFVCSHFDIALLPTQPLVSNVSGNTDAGWHISPLKLFEYMAAGLPILASDLESVQEVIENGVNGLLLPPDEPKAWRSALEYLRDNPQERKRIGENAKRTLVDKFSWEARAKKVLAGFG